MNSYGIPSEMPLKNGKMRPQERKFVETYAVTGDGTYAAKQAGYGSPTVRASQKLAQPSVQLEVRRAQLARLNNELLPLSLNLLQQVLTDDKETTRNRLTAAKIVVDRTIGQGGEAGEDKEPHEMTPAELQARIDRLRREQAERATPIIDAVPDENASQQGSVFE